MTARISYALLALVIAFSACSDDDPATVVPGSGTEGTSTPAADATSRGPNDDFSTAVQTVVDRVRPAVVQITNEQALGSLLESSETVPAGVGSGVIYDAAGHILTNDHVITGAQRLLVTLPDGRSFTGKLLGTDPQTDLAVVQITGDNLPRAEIGNSEELDVGEWVVAIGNALGLPGGPTVTTGVVSALGRAVQEPAGASGVPGPVLLDLVQTDAAINPGNSGGPLIDLDGRVIGINTLGAGLTADVPAQGIGFAISTGTIKRVSEQLVQNGRAVHPYIGIRYVPVTPAVATALGTSTREGVAIVAVQSGSPAATAGLQPRDIITRVDGQPLKEEASFARIIDSKKPGDTVTLTVERGGATREVKVTLGEAPPA